MMINRRDWLRLTAAAGAVLSLNPRVLRALQSQELITRAVPSTGELLPLVGLGSSATFSSVARSEDFSALREVLSAFVSNGGSVFDTAPSYGASEEVAGQIASDLGISDRIFWATKLNVAGRGGGSADAAAAMEQVERSFERLHVPVIDLIQVHNLGDPPTQLGILKDLKAEGRIRYIGITTTSDRQYEALAAIMRSEPLDFIGIDYAVDNRSAEETILPLAQDRGIGVLVYVPFGRTRLWNRVEGRDVPEWATDFNAHTWAQFFIKFAAAHPAVTTVTPATSQARHMVDNMGGAMGRLPDAREIQRMIELVEALPAAR
ncbi:MAG TPA: aldo/keto reductase [Longimicrobiales bacterium]|jgi:aryl-alcohol dehydrogenase-like predicted oxidoreductase